MNAIPKPERCIDGLPFARERQPLGLPKRGEINTTPAFVTEDATLQGFPHQSVRRLFFKVDVEDDDGVKKHKDYCGSVFVADWKGAKNIIFTAAHNLYDDRAVSYNFSSFPP